MGRDRGQNLAQSGIPVAQWLVEALHLHGVEYVFAVPGGPLLALFDAFAERSDVRLVLAKHEEAAGFMAEGYAQASGKLGVVLATTGPGALHALTAVASATSDSVPVLALTAQVARAAYGRGALQDSSGGNWGLDTVAAFRSATKLSAALATPDQLPWLWSHALRAALTGRRGGVHLSVPADLMTQLIPEPPSVTQPATPPTAPVPTLAEAAELISSSRRPVVLAGQGAKLSGAGPALVQLAHQQRIPVATTIKGKSVFPEDDPWSLGVFGFSGAPRAHAALLDGAVDLLIVVGSGLGELATGGWNPGLSRGRRIIQIDIDPLRLGAGVPVDVGLAGDAALVTKQLLHALAPHDAQGHGRPAPASHAATADHLHRTSTSAAMVIRALSKTLPADAMLFVDNGNCLGWIGEHYVAGSPASVHVSLNVGSMGYTTGAAIGGKLACPERPVVAVTGDAAFAMTGMDVHTAAELELPLVWVVLNNSGNAMVANVQQGLFSRSHAALYREPLDIAAVARGLGAHAATITEADEMAPLLRRALDHNGPFVIDARVTPHETPWALASRIAILRSAFG